MILARMEGEEAVAVAAVTVSWFLEQHLGDCGDPVLPLHDSCLAVPMPFLASIIHIGTVMISPQRLGIGL